MPSFSSTRLVSHRATEMFDLVADVERYPQFVPLCETLRVTRRLEAGDGVTLIVADMGVAYKMLREKFTSRVTLDRPNLAILVEYVDGPFSHLENRWTFKSIEETRCEVGFAIDYAFRSTALSLLMGAMFDTAFRRFAAAFEERADALYGRAP